MMLLVAYLHLDGFDWVTGLARIRAAALVARDYFSERRVLGIFVNDIICLMMVPSIESGAPHGVETHALPAGGGDSVKHWQRCYDNRQSEIDM